MNPENRAFFNHEEETNENKAESKERNEQINLSLVLASDFTKQIETGERLNLNEYQKTCEYAVIRNKSANKNDLWELEDENSNFFNELPSYFKEAGDENMQIFFCLSKYDIPLKKVSNDVFPDMEKPSEDEAKRTQQYLTPDGIRYQLVSSPKGGIEEVIYFDKERLSISEIKRISDLVIEKDTLDMDGKNLPPYFMDFDYDSHEKTYGQKSQEQE